MIRKIIRKFTPNFILKRYKSYKLKISIKMIEKAIKNSPDSPKWIEWDEFLSLQKKIPIRQSLKYDPESVEQRSIKRVKQMYKNVKPLKRNINSILELGCSEGKVCHILQKAGKKTTGIDITPINFVDDFIKEGVNLIEMDAKDLKFPDESFDLVFSFNSFEHFLEPEKVLKEIIRVVKTNGFIYLSFGPLYNSPGGLHASRSTSVPYCQHLVPIHLVRKISENFEGLKPFGNPQLNKWEAQEYRNLWNKYSSRLKKVKYIELPNTTKVDIIKKYPSCFNGKVKKIDSFFVDTIIGVFQKIS